MAKVYFIIITFLHTQGILFSQNQNSSINSPKEQALTRQAGQRLKFEHINTDDGLSSNTVRCILQDSEGFIWFGTDAGLNKYNGYNFTYYYHEPKDSNSLLNSYINSIQEDLKGNLWIGSSGGLNKIDKTTGKIIGYKHDANNPNSLSDNTVNSIHIDSSGTLWIGTGNGLNKLKIKHNKTTEKDSFIFKHFRYDNLDQKSISHNTVFKIYEDKSGILWIGTGNALNKFDKTTETFIRFFPDKENKRKSSVRAIYEDKNGNLWIGTWGYLYKFNKSTNRFYPYKDWHTRYIISIVEDLYGTLWMGASNNRGLLKYNEKSNTFTLYRNNPSDNNSLNSNFVNALFVDKSGILWIGNIYTGINILDKKKNKFKHLNHNPSDSNCLSMNNIWSICEDRNGKVWIATWGKGVDQYDPSSGLFANYTHDPKNQNSLVQNWVRSIYEDHTGNLWFGTANGLDKYDKHLKKFTHYFDNAENPTDPNHLSHYYIYTICEDKNGSLWIGTGIGLNKYIKDTKTFKHYFHDEKDLNSLTSSSVSYIYIDNSGILWAGGLNGLNKFNYKNEQFIRYNHNPDDPYSLSDNGVTSIYQDVSKDIWIGTANGGLNKFDQQTERFDKITMKDGLPSNSIHGILEDDNGNLWLSTGNGICKYNYNEETFRNYDVLDGLQNREFNQYSCYKGPSGRLYFGGVNGFNMFYPDSIKDNPYIPPIIITSFKVSEKPFQINKPFYQTDHVELTYNQNIFSFDFVALNYTNSIKNQYAYFLEGLEEDWIYCGTQRYARYTNVPPGEYLFRVKGSNNDGIWNEEGTSVKVVILPPWWRTNLAYLIYILLFGITLYALRAYDQKRQRLKHQLEIEHIETEKYQEIDRLKSRFFANISHEFRTPLTLILSPIEQLITKKFKGSIEEGYVTIRSNAKKLLRLVNQLLSLSKLEAGQMKLQVSEQNIILVFKRIINLFSSLAERNKIDLNFTSPESLVMYFDEEKIETVLNNLLSNAFKFTPEDGNIEIIITKAPTPLSPPRRGLKEIPYREGWPENRDGVGQDIVQITVSNTGPHIPKNQLDKIFDRFYQVESNSHVEGTGIGLSLTKDLIELHHGQISEESKAGEKTIFTILIPGGKENYVEEEIESPLLKGVRGMSELDNETIEVEESAQIIQKSESENLPIVLIVEDNEEVRNYLRKNLEEKYNIIEASNGKIGIQKTKKELPDLIISDVMMPEMDGFDFCDKIKNEIITSHIPVILLTARATKEDKLEGLKTGADDYLAKPFDLEELSVRMENLIEQRKGLKERFHKEALFGIDKITSHPAENEFMEKITHIINQNIENVDYSIDDFAKDLGISRSNLFTKIKNWTDLTPNEFIQLYRLKKAAELLKDKSFNVTEVAFTVGYKNVSHFIQSFKKQFGKTPKEFVN